MDSDNVQRSAHPESYGSLIDSLTDDKDNQSIISDGAVLVCVHVLWYILPTQGNWRRKKKRFWRFWNELFHLVSCIPQNEKAVLAGDMNGHVGSSNTGYGGMHGGYGYVVTNADSSRILEFADGLSIVICNTLFMKQESKL